VIKAISIDWENTCSSGKNLPWPTHKLGDLSHILRIFWEIKGISSFLNTGRPAPYAEAALQALGTVINIPSIAENGAILYYPKTGDLKINPAITHEKKTAFAKIKDQLDELVVKLDGLKEFGKEFSFSTNPPPGMTIEDYFHQIKSGVENKLGEVIWDATEITFSQSAVDITIKGINKQTGLEFWCNEQGIKVEELAAIGDSRGDWPVLKTVALPMCPANATPETKELVKKRSGYVSLFPTTLGTIDCIAYLSRNRFVRTCADRVICEWKFRHPIELTANLVN